MINVNNEFLDDILKIEFSGDDIEDRNIEISVSNDINFKPVIEYLVELISEKNKLDYVFEDHEFEDNNEKLDLIEGTIIEIYEQFNSSIDRILEEEEDDDDDDDDDDSDDGEDPLM